MCTKLRYKFKLREFPFSNAILPKRPRFQATKTEAFWQNTNQMLCFQSKHMPAELVITRILCNFSQCFNIASLLKRLKLVKTTRASTICFPKTSDQIFSNKDEHPPPSGEYELLNGTKSLISCFFCRI